MRLGQALLGGLLVFGILGAILFNPANKPLATLLLSSSVIALGLWPLFLWLGDKGRDDIPILPLHSAFYAFAFGVAGLQERPYNPKMGLITDEGEQWALLMALLGLLSLYAGFYLIGPAVFKKQRRWQWPFDLSASRHAPLVMAAYPLAVLADKLVDRLQIASLVQITSTAQNYLFFLLLYLYFSRRLKSLHRTLVAALFLPYELILNSGLTDSFIGGALMLAIFIGITYCAATRRIPYHFILLGVAALFFLQPIKAQFRAIVRDSQSSVKMSQTEKMEKFLSLGYDYYFKNAYQDQMEGAISSTSNRINQLHMTSAIAMDTPERQPYLYGETYLPLLTKWIPRMLWPGKPLEDLGNRWARRYGYLDPGDFETSFNLPWLPEMYMNFGAAGVIGVSFVMGLLFHFLTLNFWSAPGTSCGFAFGMMLGSPLIRPESHLSMTLGGLFVSTITLLALSYLFASHFFNLFTLRRRPS